jgi:hypothetical protein
MENMDVVDKQTPTGSNIMDTIPPYIANGHYGHTMTLSYTEKVRGPKRG